MTNIYNRNDQLEKRRCLRQYAPEADRLVWAKLRGRQLGDYKFRRQVSVGYHVLDFYCPACKVAFEVDGSSHDSVDAQENDRLRQSQIELLDIRFFRTTNTAVYQNLPAVLEQLLTFLNAQTPSQDSLSPSPWQGEGAGG